MDVPVVPVEDNIGSPQERVAQGGKGSLLRAKEANAILAVYELRVRNADSLVAKGELDGARLASIQAVNHVPVGGGSILSAEEGGNELVEDRSGK